MLPLEWICSQFEDDQSIPEDGLQNAIGDSLAQQALLTLNFLVTQGIVSQSMVKGRSNFVVQDMDALRQLLQEMQAKPHSPREAMQEGMEGDRTVPVSG